MIFLIAAILFLSLLMPRGLAILPGLVALGLYAAWPALKFSIPRPLPGRSLWVPVILIISLAALSGFWSNDLQECLERSGKIALVLGPGILFTALLTKLDLFSGRFWWIIPVTLAAGALMIWFENSFDYPVYRLLRGIGTGERVRRYELNRAMVVLVMCAIPCLSVLLSRQRHRFIMTGGLLACILGAFMVTESQSAQIALLVGVLSYILFPVKCRISWIALGILLCVGILTAPFLSIALFSMVPHDAVSSGGIWDFIKSANMLPRLEIWDFASRYILEHPWLGYGVEATRRVPAFDNQQIYQPGLTLLHPHNGVLQIWMEFGLLGALLAAAGMGLLVKRIANLKDFTSRRTALALLLAFLSVGVVGYGLWQGWWLGLMILATGLALSSFQTASGSEVTELEA